MAMVTVCHCEDEELDVFSMIIRRDKQGEAPVHNIKSLTV